ncbi:hypothetical protein EJ08DRAFT_700350 [Tothia fuscella]|uniref:Uncharacterized protein n=1 Tax=Tothia fuscella TaxID=1048955 RepID=A0A9P4TUP2_9PEZI|nr:hypothetical protein EJ08DRAFT_700350 [Tothia fuscella]
MPAPKQTCSEPSSTALRNLKVFRSCGETLNGWIPFFRAFLTQPTIRSYFCTVGALLSNVPERWKAESIVHLGIEVDHPAILNSYKSSILANLSTLFPKVLQITLQTAFHTLSPSNVRRLNDALQSLRTQLKSFSLVLGLPPSRGALMSDLDPSPDSQRNHRFELEKLILLDELFVDLVLAEHLFPSLLVKRNGRGLILPPALKVLRFQVGIEVDSTSEQRLAISAEVQILKTLLAALKHNPQQISSITVIQPLIPGCVLAPFIAAMPQRTKQFAKIGITFQVSYSDGSIPDDGLWSK